MGNASALAREENQWRLERAIVSGKVRTVKSAMYFLGLSRGTVLSYLRTLDISIINDESMKMTPGNKVYYLDS